MTLALGLVGAAGSDDGNSSTTASGTTSAGSCLLAMIASGGSGSKTLADSKSNTWTPLLTDNNSAGDGSFISVYKNEGGTRGTSHTFTATKTGDYPSVLVVEITGSGVVVSVLGSAVGDTSQPFTSNSLTTLEAAEMLVAFFGMNGAGPLAWGDSFTSACAVTDVASYWTAEIATRGPVSTGTYSASAQSFVGNSTVSTYLLSVKESGGGSAAELEGTASSVSTGAGALSTAIRLAAAAASVATAVAALNSGVVMSGAASSSSSVSASLTTQTRLNAAASSVSTVTAVLPADGLPVMGGHEKAVDSLGVGGGATISTPGFTTQSGSIIIVCVARGVIGDFYTSDVYDNKGNGDYTPIDGPHAYALWGGAGTRLYEKLGAAGGAGHVVTTDKPNSTDELTLFADEFRGVNAVVDFDWNEDLSSPNTSNSVTTTGPAILAAYWWGDNGSGELNPVPDSNWIPLDHTSSLAGNHIQGGAAYRIVDTAGTYSVTWTPGTAQGAQLYIVAMQLSVSALVSSAGSVGTVTAALSSGIRLAATPSSVSAVTADLRSPIHLAADSGSVATATAFITTAVRLAGSVASASTATAALTTAAGFSAAAVSQCTASAALTAGDAVTPQPEPSMSTVRVSHVKAHLRITHNSDDVLLQDYINQAEDEILAYLDRDELPRRGEFQVDECDSNTLTAVSDSDDLAPSVRSAIYLLVQAMYEGKDADEMQAIRRAAEIKAFPYRNRLGV